MKGYWETGKKMDFCGKKIRPLECLGKRREKNESDRNVAKVLGKHEKTMENTMRRKCGKTN